MSSLEPLDWEKCIICQQDTSESLQSPSTGKCKESGAGYQTIATNISRLMELDALSMNLHPLLLRDTTEVIDILRENHGKWHKTCNNLFNNLKVQRAEKRKSTSQDDTSVSDKKVTRTSCSRATVKQNSCLVCGDSAGILHKVSTFRTDSRIRSCAEEIQDTVLLAKLSAGDLISQDAVYHSKCLVSLYKKAEQQKQSDADPCSRKYGMLEGIALAELIAFIEESSESSETATCTFKLADLAKSRQNQLGMKQDRVNSTHLKKEYYHFFQT